MKRCSLEEISRKKNLEYGELCKYLYSKIADGHIKPVKSSGLNGKKPAMYLEYWIIDEKKDYTEILNEIRFSLATDIAPDYYLAHPKTYEEDREYVTALSDYIKSGCLDGNLMSKNERSFDIWKKEKFLSEGGGKKVCDRCGISQEYLRYYETFEPISYYSKDKSEPQTILIIENKDTYFTMRNYLIKNAMNSCENTVNTLIYGAGKGVVKAFRGYELSCESYMCNSQNRFLYFGDLDFEGILIFETLRKSMAGKYDIVPYTAAYIRMLEKMDNSGQSLPDTKEGQNRNIGNEFMQFFEADAQKKMMKILSENKYIPQECVNCEDMRELLTLQG